MLKSNEFNPAETRVNTVEMKKKDEYLSLGGDVDRSKFKPDIRRRAHERGVSVPTVLAEFFNDDEFTKKEMGNFAVNTSSQGDLVEGAIILFHALRVTAETALSMRILEDYICVDESDPAVWGYSWIIDSAMNWPLGTSLSSSQAQLGKI